MLQHVVVSLKLHWAVYVFQMKPTRCTLIVSIFISTSLHVSGNYVPVVRRNYCIYGTLVFLTMGDCLVGTPDSHPYRAHSCPKQVEKLK